MPDILKEIDISILQYINGHHNGLLDTIMWYVSEKTPWIPLYIILLFVLIRQYKIKVIWVLIFIAALVVLSDQLSVLIKNFIERPRPGYNTEINETLRYLNNYKGGQFGFVSSNAANTFGLAVLLSLFIRNKWFTIGLLSWSLLNCYSRIYLGVHYPSDIAGGIVLGLIIALLLRIIYKKIPYIQPT